MIRFSFLGGKISSIYFFYLWQRSLEKLCRPKNFCVQIEDLYHTEFMFFFLAVEQINPHLINCNDDPRDEFCKNGVSPTFCKEKVPGKYAHPTICNKFIDCSHGRTIAQDCPPGTGFNPFFLSCDWPGFLRCADIRTGMYFSKLSNQV